MKPFIIIIFIAILCSLPARGQDPATELGLTSPVSVVFFGKVPDGGSNRGLLRDANGVEYHFNINPQPLVLTEQSKLAWAPPMWLVGAEYNSGKSDLLPESDIRIQSIISILVAWVDKNVSLEEQKRLKGLPHHEVDLRTMTAEEIRQNETKWLIVARFKGEGW